MLNTCPVIHIFPQTPAHTRALKGTLKFSLTNTPTCNTCTHMHSQECSHIHTFTHVHVPTYGECTHTLTYAHTHTHSHTHMQSYIHAHAGINAGIIAQCLPSALSCAPTEAGPCLSHLLWVLSTQPDAPPLGALTFPVGRTRLHNPVSHTRGLWKVKYNKK